MVKRPPELKPTRSPKDHQGFPKIVPQRLFIVFIFTSSVKSAHIALINELIALLCYSWPQLVTNGIDRSIHCFNQLLIAIFGCLMAQGAWLQPLSISSRKLLERTSKDLPREPNDDTRIWASFPIIVFTPVVITILARQSEKRNYDDNGRPQNGVFRLCT